MSKLVTTLTQQVSNLHNEIKAVGAGHSDTVKTVIELKTNLALIGQQITQLQALSLQPDLVAAQKTQIALIERDVEDLKKAKDEWGKRIWAMAGPIFGAVIGVILGYFLRK